MRADLTSLKEAAKKQVGELADQMSFEDGQLLRRLIARRCIYGVDINPLSVDLARLSIWIYTFVPGLPLSVLDHNLVAGDFLIGIGSIEKSARRSRLPGRASFRSTLKACLDTPRAH